jgi:integrase
MARSIHRLTAVKVSSLKDKGLYPDGGGLYLRITDTASKSWIFRFTVNGALRDMGFGPVPTVSLAKARELAAECRTKRLLGIDPIDERREQRSQAKLSDVRNMTFRQCAEALIASHEPSWRNAKHRQQWRSSLATDAYPVLGDVAVRDIDTEMVLQVLQPIWTAKTETACRIRGRIEAVLDWAKVRGARNGENPARWRGHLASLLPKRSKLARVRHHNALPYPEISEFLANLRQHGGIAGKALEFLIFTVGRSGEVLGARWDEIDLDGRLWVVPAERMKSHREHRVPLSLPAVAILEEMAEVRQNEFVFFGMKLGRSLTAKSFIDLLRRMGRTDITTHGFRSSFRDWAGECTSFPREIAEAALAHVGGSEAERAYRRGDALEKRRELMAAWAAFCTHEYMSAEVVPFRRPRSQ